jgi:replicative DNA helicase
MADLTHPIDTENEALIIANAIKDDANRNAFIRMSSYDKFRSDEYKTLAWGVIEAVKENIAINVDAVLLKSKSCPIRKILTFEFINKLVENFPTIPEENFRSHLEKLHLDMTKQSILEVSLNSLYPACTNSTTSLSDLETRIDYLKDMVKQGRSASKLGFKSMAEIISDYDIMKAQGIDKRTTGFFQLDEYLTEGFKEGQITTVAGLSSQGKSSLALTIMKNLSQLQTPVPTAQFALEMNNMSLTSKLLAFRSMLPLSTVVKNPKDLDQNELAIYEHEKSILAQNKYIFFNDNPSQSVANVREQTMLLQDHIKQQYIVVVIDLFGKLRDLQTSDNFARDYEKKLNEIQVLVRELGIHMILVAQINREVGKRQRRPTMNDLKNAHALTEVSDIILGIHRPYYDSDKTMRSQLVYGLPAEDDFSNYSEVEEDPDRNVAEIILLKQRMGPKDVLVNFIFDSDTTCFYPILEEYQHRLNQKNLEEN